MEYRFSIATIYHLDKEADTDIRCRVEIDADLCVVVYDQDIDDRKQVVVRWEGASRGNGHYDLTAKPLAGHATLHRIEDSRYLEGFWKEKGFTGMWRIELKN